MHSIMKVGDKKFVLTTEQLDTILGVLFDAPIIHSEYVGTGKGDEGTAYIKTLKRVVSEDGLTVDTMPDAYIAALEFKTKLYLENKPK
jgi:hypothetical protein